MVREDDGGCDVGGEKSGDRVLMQAALAADFSDSACHECVTSQHVRAFANLP
jgi:hypothetical protein